MQMGDCSQEGDATHQDVARRLGGAAVGRAALAGTVESRSSQQYAEKCDACPQGHFGIKKWG